ncbi:MAG: SRPBCC family protein [Dehalococcoidia bacterium]
MDIEIAAPPSRVWRALCDPAEVIQWDSGVEEALDAPADYPRPGQHVRWRYSNGPFRTLHDRPQEVVVERKLSSDLAVGPFKFHETYTLEDTSPGCRLSAAMNVWAVLPLAGSLVERLYLGAQTRRAVEASLRAIKRHCEETP